MRKLGKTLARLPPILRPFLCTVTTFDLHSNRQNRFAPRLGIDHETRVTIEQERRERERERISFNLLLLPQVRLHCEYYKIISLALLLSFKDEVSQVTQERRVLRIRSSDGPYQKLGNDRMQLSISYSLSLLISLAAFSFSPIPALRPPSPSPFLTLSRSYLAQLQ